MPYLLSLSLPVQEVLKPVLVDMFYLTVTELILIFCLHCLLSDKSLCMLQLFTLSWKCFKYFVSDVYWTVHHRDN